MDLFDLIVNREQFDKTKEQYDTALEKATGIIICGLGGASGHVFRYLEGKNLCPKIKYLRDKKYTVNGIEEFNGYPVISDDELKKVYDGELIICTPKTLDGYWGCINDMKAISVPEANIISALDVIFFEDSEMYNNRKMPLAYLKEHKKEFEEAYLLLQDERSRQVFTGVLNYKLTGDMEHYMLPITSKQGGHGFDDDFFTTSDEDIYIDLGAYTGDTARLYIKKTNGHYGKILCFEPDPVNYQKLSTWLKLEHPKNVFAYEIGAGAEKGELTFSSSENDSSHVTETGNITIKIDAVDNILKGGRADYIKFDVEGSEYEALLGLRETIQKYHPNMCISCYHLQSDFYKLPLLVKRICPGYKLYLRQYLMRCTSTELFAIYEA